MPMEFLKNNYEKVILIAVLVLLAVAAGYLPIEYSAVKRSLEEATRSYTRRTVQPLEPPNLSTNRQIIQRAMHPAAPQFASLGHNIFNPIRWIQGPDGTPIAAEDFGVKGLVVERIIPLYTRIEFLGVRVSPYSTRYEFQITQQASTNRTDRTPRRKFLTPGEDAGLFRFREVLGDPKNPKGAVVEIVDEPEPVVITTNKPYQVIAGYAADLRQKRTNRLYSHLRVGDRIIVGRSVYNVVAIEPTEVTLEESQTRKRVTLRLNTTQKNG